MRELFSTGVPLLSQMDITQNKKQNALYNNLKSIYLSSNNKKIKNKYEQTVFDDCGQIISYPSYELQNNLKKGWENNNTPASVTTNYDNILGPDYLIEDLSEISDAVISTFTSLDSTNDDCDIDPYLDGDSSIESYESQNVSANEYGLSKYLIDPLGKLFSSQKTVYKNCFSDDNKNEIKCLKSQSWINYVQVNQGLSKQESMCECTNINSELKIKINNYNVKLPPVLTKNQTFNILNKNLGSSGSKLEKQEIANKNCEICKCASN